MIRRRFIFALAFATFVTQARAATLELVPMLGYQFNGSKDLAGPTYNRLDFRNSGVSGLSVGYLTTDDGEMELSWVHSNTAADIQRSGGAPADHLNVTIDQFHFNGLYMTDSDSVQPFALLGLGATLYTPAGDREANTRFSVAIGGGVKWLWNDHIGLRFDALWTPALVLSGSHFFCGEAQGCYTTEENSYLSHVAPILSSFQFTSGLMLRY